MNHCAQSIIIGQIRKFSHYFVLAFLPFMLLVLYKGWVFTNPFTGWIDSWLYTGYFHRLSEHLSIYGNLYFGTRLPWLLSGYLINKIFDPTIAEFALHAIYYLLSIFSFYEILKRFTNSRIALFVSIVFGGYGYYVFSAGWDYLDGAVLTYTLLCLLFLTISTNSNKWKFYLLCSGFLFACMIYTHLIVIVYFPIIILYYLYINKAKIIHVLVARLGFFVLGFVLSTIVFSVVNTHYSGDFLFFLPQLKTAFSNLSTYHSNIASWLPSSTHLIFPIAIIVFCLLSLVYRIALSKFWSKKISVSSVVTSLTPSSYLVIQALLLFLIFLLQQLSFGNGMMLQYFYYVTYLFPVIFLALGGLLFQYFNTFTISRLYYPITALVFFVIYLSFTDYFRNISRPIFFHYNVYNFYYGLVIVVVSFVLLITMYKYSKFSILLITIGVVIVNTFIPEYTQQYCDEPAVCYNAVIMGMERLYPSQGPLKFWFNTDEIDDGIPYGKLFLALSSTNKYCSSIFTNNFPSPDTQSQGCPQQYGTANQGDQIVLLYKKSYSIDTAIQVLNKYRKTSTSDYRIEKIHINSGDINYDIAVIKVLK